MLHGAAYCPLIFTGGIKSAKFGIFLHDHSTLSRSFNNAAGYLNAETNFLYSNDLHVLTKFDEVGFSHP